MAVHRRGYRRYQGPLTGHRERLMVVPRFAWERLLQQRMVVLFLALSMIWPLLCAGFVYLANHSELWAGLGSGLADFLRVDGRFFSVFMGFQSVCAVVLAALAGPGLVAPDLANNGLQLYFSRPFSRADYVLAKLLVLVGVLSLITWAPALALFGMQTGMGGWSWFSRNWQLGFGVTAGFLMWILLVSLAALASSAYVKWKLGAGALILGFFFVLGGVAKMVNVIFRVNWGTLLNPAEAMHRIWCSMLGVDPPSGPGTPECIVAISILLLLLLLVLARKLRPVEVIS